MENLYLPLRNLQIFYSQPRIRLTFSFRINIGICIFYFIILRYELVFLFPR